MSDDKIIRLEKASHQPDSSCSCPHYLAAVHLLALASVFEEAGDYAAADTCMEWAGRASSRDDMGERLARAVIDGVYADGS